MAFDVEGARKAGYSDAEIADHLAKSSKFDVAGARNAGYSDSEIISHMSTLDSPKKQTQQDKSFLEQAGEKAMDFGRDYVQNKINESAGVIRGAGSIGATVMLPYDMAKDAIEGRGLSLQSNRERRQAIDDGLQTLGAQPDSAAYKVGKLGAEVAGTAGIGGVLGKGAEAIGAAPKVVSALTSGGFSTGAPVASTIGGKVVDAALRAGAGAVTGAAQAGAVDPESAGAGALVGGALPGAVQLAGKAGAALQKGMGWLASNALGATTGAGADAIKTAFQAGKDGSQAFLDNIRGNASFDDVVASAKNALSTMRQARSAAYKSGMVDIKNDKSVLDFADVDKALRDVVDTGSYKGVAIRQKAAETVNDLKAVVDNWRGLDPAEYHTPEGLDALKQAVWDVAEGTKPGSAGDRAVKQVYNAIKATINKQAPTYAKVMGDYSKASDTLKEVEKALSLGDKTARDTSIRKLQSLMRNNAQSNYGNRLNLAKQLEDQGGADIMPAVAGQALNTWVPRGMVGAIEKAGAIPTAALAPHALLAAPLTSPRLIGEAAYALGRGAGSTAAQGGGRALSALTQGQNNTLTNTARSLPLLILSNQRVQQ